MHNYFNTLFIQMLKKILLLCMLCMGVHFAYSQTAVLSATDSIVARAAEVARSGNMISKLSSNRQVKHPVGLGSPSSPYSIVIDRIELTDRGGFMDVSAAIPIPGSDKPLCFRARRVPFSASGGFSGSARMELVSEVRTSLVGGMDIVIPKDGKTFVEFDCDGFKQMGLSADLLFRSDLLVPVGGGRENRVTAHLETVVKDANDIMASISMSPFAVKGLDGFTFTVKEASIDQSDYNNFAGFKFPRNYNNMLYASQPTLWRGVFLKRVDVTLPGYLSGSSKEPITVSAENLLFDDSGISGLFSATSVLPLEKGEIPGGFAISIGKVAMELAQNELVSGSLSGSIRLPISSKDTLGYTAKADASGKFAFTATPTSALEFDVWKAKAKIDPSSLITIDSDENGIVVKTLLNGNLSIAAPVAEGSSKKLEMTVPFEELYLSNRAPYFEVKAFGINNLDAKQSLAGFSYSINSIGFSCKGINASLAIGVDVAVGGTGSNAFSAGGKLELRAVRENSGWKYKSLEIDKFTLATEFSGFKLSGSLALFNDSRQYGDGIGGNIKMELVPLKFEVGAAAIFGRVDGYSYWYADAFTTTKIPVGTGLMLTSLGGGAYSKMKQGMPANSGEDYGRGSSGICYVPDKSMSFGFMAKVGLSSADGKIVNGDAALEMAFNAHGGISYISFLGHAEIMAAAKTAQMASAIKEQAGRLAVAVDKINAKTGIINDMIGKEVVVKADNAVDLRQRAEAVAEELKKSGGKAPISATLYSIFDFNNSSFFAKLEASVDVAGVLKGIGEGGKAGEMVMYFGPDKWYVHCGTPTTPIGLELLGLARTTSYFMMGHDLPAFPEPPQKVMDIIGLQKVDRSRDISSLAGGTGIAFGSSFEMDTGNLQFLMFYARFAAGLGFDVMLKNYGSASCAGEDGRLGINGWYAMGQAWAYVQGEVGIRVKMMFIRGTFPILKIGMGTLLEAQLPNPSWFHGAVGGYYNILGGLVKGRCKFEFELGKKCKIKSSAKDLLANMNIISDIRPSEGASDVSVFSKPQAIFNMPINKSFAIDAPDGMRYQFRAKLDRFVALDGGRSIEGELKYNDDSTVITINPHKTLPQQKDITISAEISYEEYKFGRWEKVTDSGNPIVEKKAGTFKTGDGPKFIPESNVVIQYPVKEMKNYYKDEYTAGYVNLDMWQDYLLSDPKYKTFARIKQGELQVAEIEVKSDGAKKQITFAIPSDVLKVTNSYTITLVNVPIDKNSSNDKNVKNKETKIIDDENEQIVTSKEAVGNLEISDEVNLYEIPFQTSRYSLFKDKVAALTFRVGYQQKTPSVMIPYLKLDANLEAFDLVEAKGTALSRDSALVRISSNLSGNRWFASIDSLIYKDYPFLGKGVTDRNTVQYGLIPYRAVSIDHPSPYIDYLIPYVIDNDYYMVVNNLASLFVFRGSLSTQSRKRLETLMSTPTQTFTTSVGESLPLLFRYVLPDGRETSNYTIYFKYFINR